MIDLRQLHALRAVHSEGSVTRAASLLGWSQPTVDYHLRNLERLIGAPVLLRSTRGSTLTPVGTLLSERGSEILTLADRALHDARELTQMGQVRLRFGIFPTAASQLLPSIVSQLRDLGIDVDVVLEETIPLAAHLNQRELDAALLYAVPGYDLPLRDDMMTSELLVDPLLLALPADHRLATSAAPLDTDTLLTLGDERWLLGSTQGDPMDSVVIDAFAAAGHSLDASIRTDDTQLVLSMIAARMAIGLVPRIASAGPHTGVVLREIDHPSFARSILLAAPAEGPRRRASTPVRQLEATIRHALAEVE